jgi:cytochrome c5
MANDGKVIYAQICAQCHANGVAGAPRIGDKAAWIPRLATGRDALMTTVLKGKGAMPPKGGNASLSDAEAKAAMDYILDQVR